MRARIGNQGDPESWSLQRWLPELAFIDAVNGFMRLRATGDFGRAPPPPSYPATPTR